MANRVMILGFSLCSTYSDLRSKSRFLYIVVSHQVYYTSRRFRVLKFLKLSKEVNISIAIIAIPLIIAYLLMRPLHEEYITKGDITPVSNIGVNGSVHFTSIYSGYIETYYDKLYVSLFYRDADFIPIDEEEFTMYTEDSGVIEEDYYKIETISNAIYATGQGDENDFQERIEDILFESSGYYGDSLGLMVAIGLTEEVNHLDFSQNGTVTIAGTGTLEYDKTVGTIGGMRQKLLTAVDNNVDIFFIPKDEDDYGIYSNEWEARRVLKEEGLDLNVIPVETLEEAINYLKNY
jgi:PDZ domain-containing protein